MLKVNFYMIIVYLVLLKFASILMFLFFICPEINGMLYLCGDN